MGKGREGKKSKGGRQLCGEKINDSNNNNDTTITTTNINNNTSPSNSLTAHTVYLSYFFPDASRASVLGESEHRIWTPIVLCLVPVLINEEGENVEE